ncbi:hypothetical protein [Oceanobacillus jeddahense]|uniref:DUF5067 domain-containing protein n=1 Tax=Oceanobacillus jeddahense TaxID=1462527 RepID=A0ABY5JRQ9_9BACI|nr:hypothetical protein [Oceanobacillus jeddahense]UUI02127.1 hypothetical protein NP439_19095 [Oceanobacillus jeddahense]
MSEPGAGKIFNSSMKGTDKKDVKGLGRLMKNYLFLVMLSLLFISGCNSEAGSMPGFGSTTDEFLDEYGENHFDAQDEDLFVALFFNYMDESSSIYAGMSAEEDTIYAFGLDFLETDEPERTYDEALEEAEKYMPQDAEEVNEEPMEDGVILRFESSERFENVEMGEDSYEFNVELIEGDNEEMYSKVRIAGDMELNNPQDDIENDQE